MDQIERMCRQQTDVVENLKFALDRVENIVGKGENAGNQHFLLFSQCFQKLCFNPFRNKPWILHVCSTSLLKKTVGKGEMLLTSNFSFSQCFLPVLRTFSHFHQVQNCHLQTLSVWKSLKFVIWERVTGSFKVGIVW